MRTFFAGTGLAVLLLAGCQSQNPADDTREAATEVQRIAAWVDRTASLDALADSAAAQAARVQPYVEAYAETPPASDTLGRAYRSIRACHDGLVGGQQQYGEIARADHPLIRASLEVAVRSDLSRCALSASELRDLGY